MIKYWAVTVDEVGKGRLIIYSSAVSSIGGR